MNKIKLGMIGGGIGAFIGDAHRRASRICNEYELLGGVFDEDYEKGKEFAQLEGIELNRCYATIDEFIKGELALPEKDRIQAVAIVTPNHLHYEFAKKLIENRFHVICEKPVTITVEEAEDLKRLLEKHKVVFGLTHTYTGYPMVRQMRELVKQDILGEIQRVDAQYYQGWINSIIHGKESRITGIWRLDPKFAGASSCMGDIGVHAFNLIEYTTGLEIKKILADLNNVKDDIVLDLDGTVLLRFEGKLRGVIRASQVAGGEENNIRLAIYGSKASLKWEQENPNKLYLISDDKPIQIFKPAHDFNSDFAEASHTMPPGHPEGIYIAFSNIYKGVAKAIRGQKYFDGEFPTIDDGIRGMKFIEGAVKSSNKGNIWVDL